MLCLHFTAHSAFAHHAQCTNPKNCRCPATGSSCAVDGDCCSPHTCKADGGGALKCTAPAPQCLKDGTACTDCAAQCCNAGSVQDAAGHHYCG